MNDMLTKELSIVLKIIAEDVTSFIDDNPELFENATRKDLLETIRNCPILNS